MLNEQQLEELCLGWFQETGWRLAHGPDIAPDSSDQVRACYQHGDFIANRRSRTYSMPDWNMGLVNFPMCRFFSRFSTDPGHVSSTSTD